MRYTLTRDELIAMKPCGDKLKRFGDAESMNVRQAFDAGFTVSDILWVAGRLRLIDQIVVFANGCAAAADDAVVWYAAAAAARCANTRYAGAAARHAADAADAAFTRLATDAGFVAYAAENTRQKQHLIELFSEEAAQ